MGNVYDELDINIPPKSVFYYVVTILCLIFLKLYLLAVCYAVFGANMIIFDEEGDTEDDAGEEEFWASQDDDAAELLGYELLHRDLEHYLDMITEDEFPSLDFEEVDPLITVYQNRIYQVLSNNNITSMTVKQNIFEYSRLNFNNNLDFKFLLSKFKSHIDIINFDNEFKDISLNVINLFDELNIVDKLINNNLKLNFYFNYSDNFNLSNDQNLLFNKLYDKNLSTLSNNKYLNSDFNINFIDIMLDNLSIYHKRKEVKYIKKKKKLNVKVKKKKSKKKSIV